MLMRLWVLSLSVGLFLNVNISVASPDCSEFLEQMNEVEHTYIDLNLLKTNFKDYNKFAQAVTEGLQVKEENLSLLEGYFNKYFQYKTKVSLKKMNLKDKKNLVSSVYDPGLMKSNVFKEAVFKVSRLRLLDRKIDSLTTDDQIFRSQWVFKSKYLRLRALQPVESFFSSLLAGDEITYSEDLLLTNEPEGFYQSSTLPWNHQLTLTNDKNESMGLIRISIEEFVDSKQKTQYVAVVQSVLGIPLEVLDQTLLALKKIVNDEGLLLSFRKYRQIQAFIDIPLDERYRLPFLLDGGVKITPSAFNLEPYFIRLVLKPKKNFAGVLTQKRPLYTPRALFQMSDTSAK